MPSLRVKEYNEKEIHFVTLTVIEWIDIFTKREYFECLSDSLNYCIKNKSLTVLGYVFMTNHIHLLIYSSKGNLSDIVRDFKRYTTLEVKKLLERDSRKYILGLIKTSKYKRGNFQIWQENNYPEVVIGRQFYLEKLKYIHENPVKRGYVTEAVRWQYSSAADYFENKKGRVNVEVRYE